MKKSVITLALSLICFNVISQNNVGDSLLRIVSSYLGQPPVKTPPSSDDTYLRGEFVKVFKNPKIWEDFVKGPNKKYLWIEAPETNWYDLTEGPLNSNRFNLCENPVMIDSTVVNYYNTKIKNFKYDRYTYEIIHQRDGITVQEFYKFFLGDSEIRCYLIAWKRTELLNITDFDFDGRL